MNSWTRRTLIQGLSGLGTVAALGGARVAFAGRGQGSDRLLFVLLRGGLDGLAAVPPHGDRNLARSRGRLALGAAGEKDGVLDLDGTFGLHPALSDLVPLYGRGELLPVHAICTPYRGRSHFDAQDLLESGGEGLHSGWLNRALVAGGGEEAVVLAQTVPLVLSGPARVLTVAPDLPPPLGGETLERVAMLYGEDPELAVLLEQGLAAREATIAAGLDRENRGRGSQSAWQGLARLMAVPGGPTVGMLELEGWDTHARQGPRLARLLADLGAGLASLPGAMGPAWDRTVVVVVSEFGRAVEANGTGGTDHGTGGVALLAGGAVAGGRVLADWPGLAPKERLDGRDLRPTVELRGLLKGVLGPQLGLTRTQLDGQVFPYSAGVEAVEGLVRGD